MSLAIEVEPFPLAADTTGTVRVGGTRVTLDTVVGAFMDGLTAEEIAQQYPVLTLADVYAAIAYFLRHRERVETYLADRQAQATELRCRIERLLPSTHFRERLLARHRN